VSNLTAPTPSSTPGPNPNVPPIPHPVAEVGSLLNSVRALQQGVESLAGTRGSQINRAVTFNDLTKLGLASTTAIMSPNGQSSLTNAAMNDQVTTTTSTLSNSVAALQASINTSLQVVAPPVHDTSPGTPNQVAFDTGFFYVCTATNTWLRIAWTAGSW
jgi:hypothetical protein